MSKKCIIFDESEEDGLRSIQFGKVVIDIDIFQELDFITVNFPTVEGETTVQRDDRFWDWYTRRISGMAGIPVARPAVQKLYNYLKEEEKKITDFFFPKPDSSTDSGKILEGTSVTESPTAS